MRTIYYLVTALFYPLLSILSFLERPLVGWEALARLPSLRVFALLSSVVHAMRSATHWISGEVRSLFGIERVPIT